ncbi:MAG: DUF2130 domain-containing protein [Candidatus Gottesmanbacteria bacterium]
MMTTITCPHCNKPFEINDALEKDLRKHIEEDVKNKSKEESIRLQEKAVEAAKEKFVQESKLREEELAENRKQNKELREQLSELMKQLRVEKTARENAEIVMQKKLLEEQEKIRQKAKEEDSEKHRMELKERDTRLESMQKTIEELQRKGRVGSQQLQGEVQELDLEETLHATFPQDSVIPVGKGVLGADVRQIVKSPMGMDCGTILWESKRTKAWSDGWISKLKEDLLHDKAHIPAIISDTLPDEAKSGMGFKDGVWIASPKLALPLAALLRKSLLDAAKQKKIAGAQSTKADELYGFVTSHEFQHQMEAMIETYQEMQKEIQKERVSFERSWKLREMQVNKLLTGVAGLYGSMQGIAGTALSPIKSLELPNGEE